MMSAMSLLEAMYRIDIEWILESILGLIFYAKYPPKNKSTARTTHLIPHLWPVHEAMIHVFE